MQYTDNHSLRLPEYTDVIDIGDINENFKAVDGLLYKTGEFLEVSADNTLNVVPSYTIGGETLTETFHIEGGDFNYGSDAYSSKTYYLSQKVESIVAWSMTEDGDYNNGMELLVSDDGGVYFQGYPFDDYNGDGNDIAITYVSASETRNLVEEYKLPVATNETLGGVKVGEFLEADEDGTINVVPSYTIEGGKTVTETVQLVHIGEDGVGDDYGATLYPQFAIDSVTSAVYYYDSTISGMEIEYTLNSDGSVYVWYGPCSGGWVDITYVTKDETKYLIDDFLIDDFDIAMNEGITNTSLMANNVLTNKAGGKGYKVTGIQGETGVDTTWNVILESVEGLEVGMEVCARLESVNFNPLYITAISGNSVTVEGDRCMDFHREEDGSISVDDHENGAPCNYITVVDRPDLGNMDVGYYATTFGQGNIAQDKDVFVVGRDNKGIQQYAFVAGRENIGGYGSFVTGRGNIALGNCTTAIGRYTKAYGQFSFAGGMYSEANGDAAFAFGQNAKATAEYAMSLGYDSKATGPRSMAVGNGTEATADTAYAQGYLTKAYANCAHTEGNRTEVSAGANNSHAEGYGTKAIGANQHVQGKWNEANADFAHIVGGGSSDSDRLNIHTIDWSGNAMFSGSIKANTSETVLTDNIRIKKGAGNYSVIINDLTNNEASEVYSYAEGMGTKATGARSHAEGQKTTASADSSHAEGYNAVASGNVSHAEGHTTVASGRQAHAEGQKTIAAGENQHVQGYYNVEDTGTNDVTPNKIGKYAHIVGGGTSDSNRKNIHTLDWDGNAMFAGNIKASNACFAGHLTIGSAGYGSSLPSSGSEGQIFFLIGS